MAEFCTPCTKKMFGDAAVPDIDIEAEFTALKPNHYLPCLCEGCGLAAISKTKQGEMLVAYLGKDGLVEQWTELQPDRIDTLAVKMDD